MKFIYTILVIICTTNILSAQTPTEELWTAIKDGDVTAIESAVNSGADIDESADAPVPFVNSFGYTNGNKVTPLMFAVLNEQPKSVLKLLQLGAKANKMTTVESSVMQIPSGWQLGYKACMAKKAVGVTALYMAIDRNHIEITKLLLQSKKAIGGQPMTFYTTGKCIGNVAKPGNQMMLGPKQYAKKLYAENAEINEILKSFKKTDWYKNGLPSS